MVMSENLLIPTTFITTHLPDISFSEMIRIFKLNN